MNKFVRALVLLFLVCLCAGCSGKSDENIEKSNAKENKKLAETIVKQAEITSESNDRYVYFYVDLNDDGKDEVIVYLWGDNFSGTGGATMMVFTTNNDEYELISKTSLVNMPIVISQSKTNEFDDIIVSVSGGGVFESYNAVLKYVANEGYPINASVQPKVDISTIKVKAKLEKEITPEAGFKLINN